MNKRLSILPSPALAGVVRERNIKAACAEIKNCVYDGADMIDMHISCLDDTGVDAVKAIVSSTKLPILALNYNITANGQGAGFSEEERIDSLLRAIDAGAAGIDMQGYSFHLPSHDGFFGEDKYSFTKNSPREVVTDPEIIAKQRDLIEKVHKKGGEVLLSCHPGIPMKCDAVVDLAFFLEERGADIIKIVTIANTEDDMVEAFKTMVELKRRIKTPVSFHAGGAEGMLSRIINPMLGGQIVFCVDRFGEGSTPEQLDLRTARAIIDNLKRIAKA